MTNTQLLAIVAALLLHNRDKNPPHGIYETRDESIRRTLAEAKQLIRAAEQA